MTRYVRIDNLTRGSMVAERCRVARSILLRIFGLHLVPRLQAGEGLLLPGATSIDTTFMGYAIDLVFLDRSLQVTRIVPSLPPWRMVLRTDGGRDCLELPAGAAAASGTQAGDQLAITQVDISAR